jgi:hypothetical protein
VAGTTAPPLPTWTASGVIGRQRSALRSGSAATTGMALPFEQETGVGIASPRERLSDHEGDSHRTCGRLAPVPLTRWRQVSRRRSEHTRVSPDLGIRRWLLADAAAPAANGRPLERFADGSKHPRDGPTDRVPRVTPCTQMQPRRRHLAPAISRSLPDRRDHARTRGGGSGQGAGAHREEIVRFCNHEPRAARLALCVRVGTSPSGPRCPEAEAGGWVPRRRRGCHVPAHAM